MKTLNFNVKLPEKLAYLTALLIMWTALIEKGFVKLKNFSRSRAKARYLYELTPRGIRAKALLTAQFLDQKRHEYRNLKNEIAKLENELGLEEDTAEDNSGPL